jgi:hypothetical protein
MTLRLTLLNRRSNMNKQPRFKGLSGDFEFTIFGITMKWASELAILSLLDEKEEKAEEEAKSC